jgi:hypothetical protein
MVQNINQFAPTNEKGQLVNDKAASTITCIIDPDSVATIGAGTAVKLVDEAGYGLPVVEKAAATDVIFGFVPYNIKKNTFVADDIVAIASFGQEMWMEAGEIIAGGAVVEIVEVGDTVITSAGINKIVGINLTNVASGGLARILIQTPKINQL